MSRVALVLHWPVAIGENAAGGHVVVGVVSKSISLRT